MSGVTIALLAVIAILVGIFVFLFRIVNGIFRNW